MQLNTEGRARFQAHLQSFLRNPCSVCGTGSWQVEDAIFELREFIGDAQQQQQMALKPVLAMTCNGCGHIVFMSPLKTGIIGTPQAAPAETVTEMVEETTEE